MLSHVSPRLIPQGLKIYARRASSDAKQWRPHNSPTISSNVKDAESPTPLRFKASRFLQLTLIPFAIFYAVFFADFGDREHVFMPPRRWLARQKAAFFTLSPAEQDLLVRVDENKMDDLLDGTEKSKPPS